MWPQSLKVSSDLALKCLESFGNGPNFRVFWDLTPVSSKSFEIWHQTLQSLWDLVPKSLDSLEILPQCIWTSGPKVSKMWEIWSQNLRKSKENYRNSLEIIWKHMKII
jgi:hypothetical protein